MIPTLLVLGVSFLIIGTEMNPGLNACLMGAGGCLLFNFGLNSLLWRSESRYVAYKFFAVWFVLQSVFVFLCIAIFPNYFESEFEPFLPVGGKLYSMFFSYCFVPLLAVLYSRFLCKMNPTL